MTRRNIPFTEGHHYIVNVQTGCWDWQLAVNHAGYPWSGREARRLYIEVHGPMPDGWTVDHLCRNRACINVQHLEGVPHGVNVCRGDAGLHWKLKTHCPKGHPYDTANTYVFKGSRNCRECNRIASRNVPVLYIHSGDGDRRHGTVGGYSNNKCRCEDCSNAWRSYKKAYNAKRSAV